MRRSHLILAALTCLATGAAAEVSYLESNIGIEFNGCDYQKLINLKNGYVWECGEYGYAYHYGALTVIQVGQTSKLCLGDVEDAFEEYPNGHCYSGKLYRWN